MEERTVTINIVMNEKGAVTSIESNGVSEVELIGNLMVMIIRAIGRMDTIVREVRDEH